MLPLAVTYRIKVHGIIGVWVCVCMSKIDGIASELALYT